MFQPLTVLVTGATGHQGGALARLLLQRGHTVLALTRKPHSPAARELAQRGARLIPGDFEDVGSLERAARGADCLFAMATPYEAGPETEVRHGLHLLEAARRVRIRHLVYSSVAGASQPTGIPHFDSKRVVEDAVRDSGLAFTLVAPVFFMENFTSQGFLSRLRQGVLAMPLPPHRGLQMVPMLDLATFLARIIEWPEEFVGRRLEVASDEVTGEQAAALLTYVSGRRLRYEEVPLEEVRERSEDLGRMYEWFQRVGYHADIAALRRDYPEVRWHTFEDWARSQDWEALLGPAWQPAASPPAPAGEP